GGEWSRDAGAWRDWTNNLRAISMSRAATSMNLFVANLEGRTPLRKCACMSGQPMLRSQHDPGLVYFIVTALSLSIGWGIRGNFGHEYGAMIPGALAAMAAVLLSRRQDWPSALPFFAMFGALGWSFGGSISYMQVIGYTHSGHAPSQLYGFACLFVIGFLWAAIGGAGTALPALLDRERLTECVVPLPADLIAWWLQGFIVQLVATHSPD